MANAAAVIIVRNVQPLVQAVFDAAKASSVEFQPLLCVEFLRLGAGQQVDVFVLAAIGLAEQSGGLRRQGKANLFSRDRLGAGWSGSSGGSCCTPECGTEWASAAKGGKSALGAGSSFSMFWWTVGWLSLAVSR